MMGEVPAALLSLLRERVTPAYARVGDLAFVYAQGSLVAGYTAGADLDLVPVWRGDIPPPDARPGPRFNDGSRQPQTYHQPGFVVDRFWVDGQEISLNHISLVQLDGWVAAVRAGSGWRGAEYPRPLAVVSGFRYGAVVYDPDGEAARRHRLLDEFPGALARRSRNAVAEAMPGYLADLRACVERGDGLLLHELLTDAVKMLLVAWFSAQRVYMPHEKWLARAIDRHRLDGEVARLEARIWVQPTLRRKVDALEALIARVESHLPPAE